MKDKKFLVLCSLGAIWLVIFVAMLMGAKLHPKVEQLVTVLCLAWFAFWTFSLLRGTKSKKETNNAKKKESGSE